MKHRHVSRLARGLAASVALAAVAPAWAGPVEIETPQRGEAVGGSNIACVAQFESRSRPITRVVFLVDGEALTQKAYKSAATEARVAFVWDSQGVPPGPHTLTVRAYAGNQLVGEDEVPVVVSDGGVDIVKPQIHVFNPRPNSVVSGRQDIAIHANDNDRVTMVSLFINKQLKLLQNVPPFFYSWDTTQYPNGPHTIEVWAFDPAQNKGEAKPIRVFVNNATGRTNVKDLPDEVISVPSKGKAKAAEPKVSEPQPLPKATPVPAKPKPLPAAKPAPKTTAKAAPAAKPVLSAAKPKPSVQPKPAVVEPKAQPVVAAKPAPMPAVPTAKAAAPKVAAKPEPTKVSLPIPEATAKPAVEPEPETVQPASPAAKPTVVAVKTLPVAPKPAATPAKPATAEAAPLPVKVAQAPQPTSVEKIVTAKPVKAAEPVKSSAPAVKPVVKPAEPKKALEKAPAAPMVTRPEVAPSDAPVFIAQKPAETPMGKVDPQMRVSVPATQRVGASSSEPAPKAEPKAAAIKPAPAPAQPKAAPKPAKAAAPVRVARAETRSNLPHGNARTQEMAPQPVSPAAHRIAAARPPLRIMLGDEPIEFDVKPVIEEGFAIAPLRQIVEHTGGVVMWLPATKTVQATSGAQSIEVRIGSRRAKVNAQIVLMERPASLKEGRTMVPVRFLQTALNMKAVYDPSKGLVYLYKQ